MVRNGDLNSYEDKVCSQNGEDGIIEEIFGRIGTTGKFFAEFGVQNGLECNTAHLAAHCHWGGLLIEANAEMYRQLKMVHEMLSRFTGDAGRVKLANELVTAENVADIFSSNNVPTAFDLLSIDIDGNDYWVWKALAGYRPRVVVIEYNAIYAPPTRWVMPYDPGHVWDGGTKYGASLTSLSDLGKEMGYDLVATDSHGINAFFVLRELCSQLLSPLSAEQAYHPPRFGPFFGTHMPKFAPA